MTEHDPSVYGQGVSADYDAFYARLPETDAAIERLARLADGGAVLELGIGTGRLALGLVERGLRVAGIEGSPEMVDQLRAKPRGDEIPVVVGDFAEATVEGTFSLVVLALNTIFALADRDAQLACFANAAAHLDPGGVFVVEAFVLRPDQVAGGWSVKPRMVEDEHVELEVSRYHAATGRIERKLVHLLPHGNSIVSVNDVYASPGELDLMAHAAGLRLRDRWADWAGAPYITGSTKHVSVYEKVTA
jgi:SAM-dependent methyltransferase